MQDPTDDFWIRWDRYLQPVVFDFFFHCLEFWVAGEGSADLGRG